MFALILFIIGSVALLYVGSSLPFINSAVKSKVESELSFLLGGKVEISELKLLPFSEVQLSGVSLYEPNGKRCISAGKIAGGINLWTLLSSDKVELTYIELISLNAHIEQRAKDAPLNIQFLIDALSSKDKEKKPSKYDVVLHNIVIRKSHIYFDKTYISSLKDSRRFDSNHIAIHNLRADIEIPMISGDDISVDIKRIALEEKSGLIIKDIAFKGHFSPNEISILNFKIQFNKSVVKINNQTIKINGYNSLADNLKSTNRMIELSFDPIVPSEFAPFYIPLSNLHDRCLLKLSLNGNIDKIYLNNLDFKDTDNRCEMSVSGIVSGNITSGKISGDLKKCNLDCSNQFLTTAIGLIPDIIKDNKVKDLLYKAGDVSIFSTGNFNLSANNAKGVLDVSSNLADAKISLRADWNDNNRISLQDVYMDIKNANLATLTGNDKFGYITAEVNGGFEISGNIPTGNIIAQIPYFDYNGARIHNINIDASKNTNDGKIFLRVDDTLADADFKAEFKLDGAESIWNIDADISTLCPYFLGFGLFAADDKISGTTKSRIMGNSIDNISGEVLLKNLAISGTKTLNLDNIRLSAENSVSGRLIHLESDFLNGNIEGQFKLNQIIAFSKNIAHSLYPDLIQASNSCDYQELDVKFNYNLLTHDSFYSQFGIPVRPAMDVTLSGYMSGKDRNAGMNIIAPYLVQGRDKLIKNTSIKFNVGIDSGADVEITTSYPVKNDVAVLSVSADVLNSTAEMRLSWDMENNRTNHGNVLSSLKLNKDPFTSSVNLIADVKRSYFYLNNSQWIINPARIKYEPRCLEVSGIHIANAYQYLDINGRATDNPLEQINVDLENIDLDYVFDILNINNVDFGGIATGQAVVSSLFSGIPIAQTNGLYVKNLSYNGSVLGDGELNSSWDNEKKLVLINADIKAKDKSSATVRGGIYVTKDSLSFDFNANKLDIGFLQPFMSGFTSSVAGRASGNIKLAGTFSDIDLLGLVYADTITMLVDQTDVYYSGTDSIYFTSGHIEIPEMLLYDKFGGNCKFKGAVNHDFLHNPTFDFTMTDARNLMVYDTKKSKDSRWYGRIFAEGSATLRGLPGMINLDVNMRTAPKSEFTLILDETETAEDYAFLTFTDRRKKEVVAKVEESFEEKWRKKPIIVAESRPDIFMLNMELDVTPGTKMVIVMDPQAGDKISAFGNGALRMLYDTNSDEFTIYGKYQLLRGDYNFSLQDLILKNFRIVEGSSISFNGDPLRGNLDITAAYRVNTNLTDLDQSFAADPDLNRTSVPVDALLKVRGEINTPDIKFDLSLPTVTSDVERKMRSIISTEDMMNRQIIYLLALNRFYTPEYTGAEQGGEFASVASSTLSSQIQNIVGSLTDKFALAPSIKSEKSDLSDMEVDVALSSSLFDNKLLINGNMGYRDKSTSQTTFIGDFDLEYLLSRDGRLRLKAYNHFNDASYYLKSALTTQGVGIIYRKNFDFPFTFVKRMFRRKESKEKDEKNTTKHN